MSILDKFFILFETDAAEAKKDVSELDKKLDNIEKTAQRSVESSDKSGQAFSRMGHAALGAVAGVLTLQRAVTGTFSKAMQLDNLAKFSKLIDESVGSVQAHEEAVIRAGGSADGFRQSITSLNEKMIDASVKGTNEIVPFFNQLGISIVDANGKARSTLSVLPELAESFERLSKSQSAGLGKKLGLDQGTILLLQSGRREMEAAIKRQRELGVASKESTEIAEKFNDQWSDLKQVMGFAAQEILVDVLPSITSLFKTLTKAGDWIDSNQSLVHGFFIGIGTVAGAIALPAIVALNKAILANPIVRLITLVLGLGSAFALVYEDVMMFLDGNKSATGELEKKWPIIGDIIRNIAAFIKLFVGAMGGLAVFLYDIFTSPLKALEKIISIGDSAGKWLREKLGFGGDDDVVLKASRSLQIAGASNVGAYTSNSINNKTLTSKNMAVNVGDVTIHTQATNADDVAADLRGTIDRQLRSMVDNFDDGIVR